MLNNEATAPFPKLMERASYVFRDIFRVVEHVERKKLLLIGNGMSGIRCIEEIIKLKPDLFDITVIGAEPRPNYNRILLSKVLHGEHSFQEIILNDWTWYEQNRITLLAGEMVWKIDTKSRYVDTVSALRVSYDVLIIATGSSPFIPPISGANLDGVISFRTLDDCNKMTELAKTFTKAAVVGGGLLGLEAAHGLLHLGMQTEVIHNASYIMNRQLDHIAAHMLQRELEEQGMTFHLSKNTTKMGGRTRVQYLRFSDGSQLDAEVVVVAVGITPNVNLARRSGILTRRAIVVDDYMRTSASDVYAVGECAEHRGIGYGLVAPLYEQGKVLAKVICGLESAPYTGSIPYSQLKVSGVDVFSAGEIAGNDSSIALQNYDAVNGTYKKVMMAEGKVTGAILFGDATEGTTLLSMVKSGATIEELFTSEACVSPAEKAAEALPEHETVCACNGVSKNTIMQAIMDQRLTNADEVKRNTKASGSCGGCRPMVEALIHITLKGNKGKDTTDVPVCDCTDISHEFLKDAISKRKNVYVANANVGYEQIINLMNDLGWKRDGGCMLCRPSILYYFELMGLVVEEREEPQTLFKEKLYRGVEVGMGGLDGPSTELESLRTIGHRLRMEWDNVSLPYSLNVGVAENSDSTVVNILVQGIGICSSPAGYEVYLGGHAKHPVCEGQLIGVADSKEGAIQLATASLHWYRKTASYGEQLWSWMKRVGVISIREKVLKDTLVC